MLKTYETVNFNSAPALLRNWDYYISKTLDQSFSCYNALQYLISRRLLSSTNKEL